MGVHPNVGIDKFPKQASDNTLFESGTTVSVCFNYDTSKRIAGTIVRNDWEDPWITIIRLDDGRHVLSTECQYSPLFD
jgi:hypothetical protein